MNVLERSERVNFGCHFVTFYPISFDKTDEYLFLKMLS